jgi:hypothetical protein
MLPTIHTARNCMAAHCAQCHEQANDARIPPRAALEKLSPAGVLRALETGVMREVAERSLL